MSTNAFNVKGLRLKGVQYDIMRILRRRGLEKGGEVQQYIDSACLTFCEPLIPYDEAKLYDDPGRLIRSGIANTVVGSGQLKWDTPYARRWYYQPANFQGAPNRGNYWFERMKQQNGDKILSHAKQMVKNK